MKKKYSKINKTWNLTKGILTKDPRKRLGWPHLLNHPFIKDHVQILGSKSDQPLTAVLSEDQMKQKEEQAQVNPSKIFPAKGPYSLEFLLKMSEFFGCNVDFCH